MFRSLKTVELEGHRTKEIDHGGGLITATCSCKRFVIQGDSTEVAAALSAHLSDEGVRAGLEALVA